jgi:hypothetical protein
LYRFCTADSAKQPFWLIEHIGGSITYMLSTLLYSTIPTSSTKLNPDKSAVSALVRDLDFVASQALPLPLCGLRLAASHSSFAGQTPHQELFFFGAFAAAHS